ncbi:MAG TPA: septal ring lytic transglycosylase RlpA family protein [Acidimicrobiales bacterium]|nr:septal ring lytic transglycosylase RlpA family protein [Acidimicrobiales bacterium]
MGRALAAIVAAALLLAATPSAPASADARSERATLLDRIAALTDEVADHEADVVAAQFRQQAAAQRLADVRARLRERAVVAYMNGGRIGGPGTGHGAPAAYLEIAAAKEQALITGHRQAAGAAEAEERRAEETAGDHRRLAKELDEARTRLDATIAAEDAQRALEQRRADEARAKAQAAREAELAAARGRARAGTSAPEGYSPSPLDPDALVPRHRRATERQREIMKQWPFGPLPAGNALPAGLRATGTRVEGIASWYGPGFDGRPTASGAIYDQEAFTVASKELPLGTFLVVSRGAARVLVLVNDRGPYIEGRVLDLSHAAATALGITGIAPVTAEVVVPG